MKAIKKLLLIAILALITSLISATFIEKALGSDTSRAYIYASPWFIGLWVVILLLGLYYLYSLRRQLRLSAILLHLSFAVILLGAFITHLEGVQGGIHLRRGQQEQFFLDRNGHIRKLPFSLELIDFRLSYYPGTSIPMDYHSHIAIQQEGKETLGEVSMNKIYKYHSYRFYQTGYDEDQAGTTLSIVYDPWGIGFTYLGYGLLFLSFLYLMLDRQSGFRQLLRHPLLKKGLPLLLLPLISACQKEGLEPKISESITREWEGLYTLYQDRISPIETATRDLVLKETGREQYQGLSSTALSLELIYNFGRWQAEPLIRIKNPWVQELLGIKGHRASARDFLSPKDYKLEGLVEKIRQGEKLPHAKALIEADEQFNLLGMLHMGAYLKLFPLKEQGLTLWLTREELLKRPQKELPPQAKRYIEELPRAIARGDNQQAIQLIQALKDYQKSATTLPSEGKRAAELLYNKLRNTRYWAFYALGLGLIGFVTALWERKRRPWRRWERLLLTLSHAVLWTYLSILLTLRAYISGYLPLSNGYETMLWMAWSSLTLCFIFRRRLFSASALALLLSGLSLLTSSFSASQPAITALMPVLISPLLNIHVTSIMTSYTLFALMAINSLFALLRGKDQLLSRRLMLFNQVLLYVAVLLLSFGIFIGAIWANQSWGRYWGWDPKEVWALITLFVYAFPLHPKSLPIFRRSSFFHLYLLLALCSVVITYFGVNLFLGGMHSYA